MCPQQGSETSQETEHLVWTTWCFGSVATIQQPRVRNNADRWLLHSFQWLICQICIWCGEPSPAECTDMTAGTTSCESVSTVKYIWEHIRGGWVRIVMSLYYIFSENTIRVRWLGFDVLFLPTVGVIYRMHSFGNVKKNLFFLDITRWILRFTHFTCSQIYVTNSDFMYMNCTMGEEIL